MIRVFLLSRAALPANSRISAARYSSTAARYTGAPDLLSEGYIDPYTANAVTHQHQRVGHSFPFAEDGEHDQLGMRDRPSKNGCNERCQNNPNRI